MPKKGRSAKEIIESSPNDTERVLIKERGGAYVDATDSERSSPKKVYVDHDKTKHLNLDTGYISLHTHPTIFPLGKIRSFIEHFLPFLKEKNRGRLENISALPGEEDLANFIMDPNLRAIRIGVRDSETGEVRGYGILKKTKKTPSNFLIGEKEWLEKQIRSYNLTWSDSLDDKNYEKVRSALDEFAKYYHLQYRLVPVQEYEPNETRSSFRKKKALENVAATVSVVGFIGSIAFSSNTITGNVISNLNQTTSNIVGITLFVIGLIGAFLFFKKR